MGLIGFRTLRLMSSAAAILAAMLLAGCETDGTSLSQMSARALQPISASMKAALAHNNMPIESPILVRIFKEEAELEIWKQDAAGRFALLKTYPICRWSGDLGPKVKEGDRQAPEGFYQITPGLMNPNSNYYLAFNLGFPNAYDRANDRSGAFLMVHGDCSSRGCYAMTDEQMGEIFALGRESFQGGQKSFQVQAYPFRMTPLNMAKHRNSPHMAFWRMIKVGYDHFEVTRQEPKVDVCEKRYVFDAQSSSGMPLSFNSRNRCPAYQLDPQVASLIKQKQADDEQQFSAYAARNISTTPPRAGVDGGMHPTFVAKLKPKKLLDGVFGGEPKVAGAQPGTIPAHVNPPRDAGITQEMITTATVSAGDTGQGYAQETPPVTRVAASEPVVAAPATAPAAPSAKPAATGSQPSALARVGQFLGFRSADASSSAPPPPPAKPATAAAAPVPPSKPAAEAKPKPTPQPRQVAQAPAPESAPAQQPAQTSTPAAAVMNGAAPPLPTSSFDTRWGATR
jgi:murein L,D-transpeptidase YafK